MFVFKEPSDLNDDWFLGDNHKGKIPNNVLKTMSNAQIIGIQFLFENYEKKRGGAILNEEEDFNMPLQVCAFLSAVEDHFDESTPVLIICSENSLIKWHYHISEVGFKPKIINSDNLNQSGVCLISSDSLKLAEWFLNLNLFCVVIDDFDALATKLVVKKLRGSFNIGLTKRNFYENPDQKLKWSMLNWASPGCVGKLSDFYSIDRLHFMAFADNYRFWWMRLTWKFCDSLDPPNEEDLENYNKKLQSWAILHNIRNKSKQSSKRIAKETQPAKRKKSCINGPKMDDMDISNSLAYPDEMKQSSPYDSQVSSEIEVKPEITQKVLHTSFEIFEGNNVMGEKNDEDGTNFNHPKIVERENSAVTKDVEMDEDEPILSIIFSQMPLKKDDELPEELSGKEETSTKSQTYQQISDVLDNLSDMDYSNEADSDDDSFFSDLISKN